jgi:hypothetical protein
MVGAGTLLINETLTAMSPGTAPQVQSPIDVDTVAGGDLFRFSTKMGGSSAQGDAVILELKITVFNQ